ncbi:hypothetical protein CCR75_003908 [Bremia lactucae]|uniref:Uncharacterized protein n=1 Tax=Bremia lactucae TaxID=4779 RepID=A0A976FEV1_BRELC|nr:hypothetical protein CCR75_003908 [Bremia lactucae]
MFVFEAVHCGALALADVTTKTNLPFDELTVVAGRIQNSCQLTCLGGRLKRDGKRRLLVIPLRQAHGSSTPSAQVLNVGKVAVNFLHGVRDCFPSLVKKDIKTDESDLDSDEEEGYKKKKYDNNAKSPADAMAIEVQRLEAEAVEYMNLIEVKILASLDDLFNAFQISDPIYIKTLLRHDPSVPSECQLLCIDCPPLGLSKPGVQQAVSHVFSTSKFLPEPYNCGVMFSEMALTNEITQFLHIPIPRSPIKLALKGQGKVHIQESFQDATVLTFGTKREVTVYNGGKTCEEMVENIRMRHASGTFCTLVLPTKTWQQLVDEYKLIVPQASELRGKLRLRRLTGNAPCGASTELLLESL